ncbi:MAG: hypothetical protein VYB56_04255, partial [Actinomycetota bacterium]|nr:hypothetical protein [Actinomycetota bacterium]
VVVVVEVVVVVVVVVVTDVCVVGGIELEEGTSTFLVVLGGTTVRGVEDSEDVEVVVEGFIGSKLSLDVTTVVIVDSTSNVEGSSSDCVPENRLSTRNTARLPILKPANDKSGLVDSAIVLLAGCGAAFPRPEFESFIAITATTATATPKSNRRAVLCQLFRSIGCTANHPISQLCR